MNYVGLVEAAVYINNSFLDISKSGRSMKELQELLEISQSTIKIFTDFQCSDDEIKEIEDKKLILQIHERWCTVECQTRNVEERNYDKLHLI